jgi:ribosomal protein S18 acetylase RimI-like enzyme
VITYRLDTTDVGPQQLVGFFQDWPKGPSPKTHLRLLEGSNHIVLALDEETGNVVGFVTAITDGALAAYVPFLEVLPVYRGRGIARELMRRVRDALRGYYMIDLICDPELEPFYETLGFTRLTAMALRDYEQQSGRDSEESGTRSN